MQGRAAGLVVNRDDLAHIAGGWQRSPLAGRMPMGRAMAARDSTWRMSQRPWAGWMGAEGRMQGTGQGPKTEGGLLPADLPLECYLPQPLYVYIFGVVTQP
jgi:hypothetical protein